MGNSFFPAGHDAGRPAVTHGSREKQFLPALLLLRNLLAGTVVHYLYYSLHYREECKTKKQFQCRNPSACTASAAQFLGWYCFVLLVL